MPIVGDFLRQCDSEQIICLFLGFPTLLFTNRFNICTVEVATGHRTSQLVISGLKDAAALDFLYDDQTIFWTDISQERIKSARIGGPLNVSDVVMTGLVSPDGVACDWVTRKLYWVDSEMNRIEASNLDGSMRKVLFWENLDQPRAITLDPVRGYEILFLGLYIVSGTVV